jgi:hypothetical protein
MNKHNLMSKISEIIEDVKDDYLKSHLGKEQGEVF